MMPCSRSTDSCALLGKTKIRPLIKEGIVPLAQGLSPGSIVRPRRSRGRTQRSKDGAMDATQPTTRQ
jgi:hypothetical protein